ALADERAHDLVVRRQVLHLLDELVLAERLAECERLLQTNARGDRRIRELVERLVAEQREHLGDRGFLRTAVAACECIRWSEDVRLHGRTLARLQERINDAASGFAAGIASTGPPVWRSRRRTDLTRRRHRVWTGRCRGCTSARRCR